MKFSDSKSVAIEKILIADISIFSTGITLVQANGINGLPLLDPWLSNDLFIMSSSESSLMLMSVI